MQPPLFNYQRGNFITTCQSVTALNRSNRSGNILLKRLIALTSFATSAALFGSTDLAAGKSLAPDDLIRVISRVPILIMCDTTSRLSSNATHALVCKFGWDAERLRDFDGDFDNQCFRRSDLMPNQMLIFSNDYVEGHILVG